MTQAFLFSICFANDFMCADAYPVELADKRLHAKDQSNTKNYALLRELICPWITAFKLPVT
jgi:hypothetical protein